MIYVAWLVRWLVVLTVCWGATWITFRGDQMLGASFLGLVAVLATLRFATEPMPVLTRVSRVQIPVDDDD